MNATNAERDAIAQLAAYLDTDTICILIVRRSATETVVDVMGNQFAIRADGIHVI